MRILKAFLARKESHKAGRFSSLLGIILVACLTSMLSACGRDKGLVPSKSVLGPRPASDQQAAVEVYLQQYQPGALPRLFQTTRIYDRNGALIGELFDEGRRTWVRFDQISPKL